MRNMPPTDQVSLSGIEPAGLMVLDPVSGLMVRVRGNSAGGISSAPPTTGGQGNKVVAAAGTPLQLVAVSTPCVAIAITARPGNTSKVAIGFSNTVRATVGGELGIILGPGATVSFAISDVQSVWIDALVNGEGVSFAFLSA